MTKKKSKKIHTQQKPFENTMVKGDLNGKPNGTRYNTNYKIENGKCKG